MARRLRTAIPVTIVLLAASACSSPDPEPDVSHSGQVDYACALAIHVGEDADIAQWSFIGDDADAGARELAALSSLLGGSAGFVLSDQEELSEASREIFMGLSRLDTEMMQEGLGRVNEQCADLSPSSDIDVTDSGQIQYACALADHLSAEHGGVESWAGLGEDHAWHEAASVASFFGAANGQVLADHAELSEAGRDALAGTMRLDAPMVQSGLDAVAEQCAQP